MLDYLDTVLSFSVVMLLLSLLVTTLVQMIIAASGLRGAILKWAIERLLKQISPEMAKGSHASEIADAVLHHPMISHLTHRRATSIRKEELIRLLDDLATSDTSPLSKTTQEALSTVLGIARSTEFDAGMQRFKLELAQRLPDQAAQVQQIVNDTLITSRKAVDHVVVWFDAIMDRTSENFLLKTRWITALVALVLAFAFHIDSLSILRQLATRPEVRAKLVQNVDATLQRAEDRLVMTAQKAPEAQTTTWLQELRQSAEKIHDDLNATTLAIIPDPLPALSTYAQQGLHFWGTLMTVLLLSLGAPFWFNTLSQLANLRPAVAEKIEPKFTRKAA